MDTAFFLDNAPDAVIYEAMDAKRQARLALMAKVNERYLPSLRDKTTAVSPTTRPVA